MTPFERQDSDPKTKIRRVTLNPWSVQNIVYELVKLQFLRNNPLDDGFIVPEKYSLDEDVSQIYLGIAYDWKANKSSKRPAIFIQRDTATAQTTPIRGTIGHNLQEGITTKLAMTSMAVLVKVIHTDVGAVEQLATWIRNNLLTYQIEIQEDFCLRQMRVQAMTPPKPYEEAKENFEVTIVINITFDENFRVQRDALRLKTVSSVLFDNLGQPFQT
jgi:hypothetical protein